MNEILGYSMPVICTPGGQPFCAEYMREKGNIKLTLCSGFSKRYTIPKREKIISQERYNERPKNAIEQARWALLLLNKHPQLTAKT